MCYFKHYFGCSVCFIYRCFIYRYHPCHYEDMRGHSDPRVTNKSGVRNACVGFSDTMGFLPDMSPELAYLKHGNTKEIHFQEIVVSEWQCIAIVILMLTRPWVISKIENCRNANFASLWSLQVVIIMTTWVMTMMSSWRLSVFSAMSYQILDQYSLIPMYYLWWSDIFHHSEPFVKMWYESLFHTCHQTKQNNVVVNDCNIL